MTVIELVSLGLSFTKNCTVKEKKISKAAAKPKKNLSQISPQEKKYLGVLFL